LSNSRSLTFAIGRRFEQCSLDSDHFRVRSASPTIVRASGAFRAAAVDAPTRRFAFAARKDAWAELTGRCYPCWIEIKQE
jgi:hypothetical protein